MVGPSKTSTSLSLASSPKATPIFSSSSSFQVDPIRIGQGKHAEVLPEVPSPLTPFGPSDILILGMSSLSILLVYQLLKPDSKRIFSFRLSSLTKSCMSYSTGLKPTGLSTSPLLRNLSS